MITQQASGSRPISLCLINYNGAAHLITHWARCAAPIFALPR